MTSQGRIFQFKVTLKGVDPLIWRRLQVPESYSFWDLHVAIQDAMGWQDRHLHLFQVANPSTGLTDSIGVPDDEAFEGDPVTLAGWDLAIADYFGEVGASGRYEYDFGDDWQHEVLLEDILPGASQSKYPLCVAGARACPPEDCGGVFGYVELLEAIRDPAHKEHDTMLQWLGGDYDPSTFNPKAVRFENPRKRWRIAFGAE